jgi:hypothetical protein
LPTRLPTFKWMLSLKEIYKFKEVLLYETRTLKRG